MKFLNYDVIGAYENGIKVHPQDDMASKFKVIHAVPQSIADCWWFCVEDYDCELPDYIYEMKPYNLNYWKDGCHKTCEFFKKSFDSTTQTRNDKYCCYGGTNCLREKYGTIENFNASK